MPKVWDFKLDQSVATLDHYCQCRSCYNPCDIGAFERGHFVSDFRCIGPGPNGACPSPLPLPQHQLEAGICAVCHAQRHWIAEDGRQFTSVLQAHRDDVHFSQLRAVVM